MTREISLGDAAHAGRAAIVTGAAGAIGSAVARALAAQSRQVVVLDKDPRVETLADLASTDTVNACANDILARRGRCDVLVNNAGIHLHDESGWPHVRAHRGWGAGCR